MKVGGQTPDGLNQAILVLPHNGKEFVFRAEAIPDLTEFHAMFPQPKPPKILKPGGVEEVDKKDKGYLDQMANLARHRTAYMIVRSLGPSDIEWDTVDPLNPKTYINWDKDMRESGFNEIEIQRIVDVVMEANALDDKKIEWARDHFFARGQQSKQDQ